MKKTVVVEIVVNVEVNEDKFTPEFMDSFNEQFFLLDDLNSHICYIAQLKALGMLEFSETYDLQEMGIKAKIELVESEIL